jgi:ParB/RepB/Spo0J family partition protein
MSELNLPIPPRWHVVSEGDRHELHYGDGLQTRAFGPSGLEMMRDMASLFNRRKKVPNDVRCGADGDLSKPLADSTPELGLNHDNPTPTTMPKTTEKIVEDATKNAPTVATKPAHAFVRYPHNRTITKESIENLAVSISEIGVIQPVLARPIHEDDPRFKVRLPDRTPVEQYEIIAGECRVLACRSLALDFPIPVLIKDISDKEAAKLHAVENFQRKELDEIEQGKAMHHMRDTGWSTEEIMESLGVAKDFVYRRIQLLDLSEEAQGALREGNISIATARKILSLPGEVQDEALKAVVAPTHRAAALPEREAMDLLEKHFVEPQQKSQEWNERRRVLEAEYPAAKWATYEEVKKMHDRKSGFAESDDLPGYNQQSDVARLRELVVPTWGELAEKHGATLYIGFDEYDFSQSVLFVEFDPLIAAEVSACDDKPEECIFPHEKAVRKQRAEAERRELEKKAAEAKADEERKSREEEREKVIETLLGTGGVKISATNERKFIRALAGRIAECRDIFSISIDEFPPICRALGIPEDQTPDYNTDDEEVAELFGKPLDKMFKDKSISPYEALGRFVAAIEMGGCYLGHENGAKSYGRVLFPYFKRDDFPALAAVTPEEAPPEEAA